MACPNTDATQAIGIAEKSDVEAIAPQITGARVRGPGDVGRKTVQPIVKRIIDARVVCGTAAGLYHLVAGIGGVIIAVATVLHCYWGRRVGLVGGPHLL